MGIGLIWVLFVSYIIGKRERKRVGIKEFNYDFHAELSEEERTTRRPKLIWLNLLITVITIVALIKIWLPLPVIFMVALLSPS